MTQTPHDALFRETFSRPSRAMSLVKAAFAPEVVRHLDTGSAALAPGTFIDAELRSRHSDLLFRVRLSGREAFAYLLLEHQSTSDPLMPYRMLRYMLGIWERWMKDHPAATQLPVILPLVVSHDPKGWRGAATLGAVYDLAAETLADLEPWVPMFHLAVDDLSAKDDAELGEGEPKTPSPSSCCWRSSTRAPPRTSSRSSSSGGTCFGGSPAPAAASRRSLL